MEQHNIDVLATIDLIFDHLLKLASEKGDEKYKIAVQDARKATKVVATCAYIDNGDVVNALMPKELL